MRLFIDTNVFLSFYHLTNEDLNELEKLVVLITSKKLTLLLPEQVIDEMKRNRANKINDSFSKFQKAVFKIEFPAYCKDYEEYKIMRDDLSSIKTHHLSLMKKLQDDIDSHALKADNLLKNLFSISEILPRTEEIIEASIKRVNIGNPPGKKDSLGDAINWESLLGANKDGHDIYIITEDKDFYSSLNIEKFNEFMVEEWQSKAKSTIHFYRKLSKFFKSNFPDINLAAEPDVNSAIELEKDKWIEFLSGSINFSTTHSIIAKLSSYKEFTQQQAENLLSAFLDNSQVNWIASDTDIYEFYKNLDDNYNLKEADEYDVFHQRLSKAKEELDAQKA